MFILLYSNITTRLRCICYTALVAATVCCLSATVCCLSATVCCLCYIVLPLLQCASDFRKL